MVELEEKIEELESVLAQLRVDIKGVLVDLKELASRDQNPIKQKSPSDGVFVATP